ncbi:class I SAM-dependent methyltransferase [Rhizobacter fulvus]
MEATFSWIYQNNHWGSAESVSGPGSTLDSTQNLRAELPRLLERLSVKVLLDAPCGDFNWMRHLLPELNLQYIGGDIVKEIIDTHTQNYSSDRISFMHVNLICDPLPRADLLICRDCLFHFSYEDTKLVLENFIRSDITYLLTTTHTRVNEFQNKDIKTGEGRLIDLFSYPYNFPKSPIATIEDWIPPYPERAMCLWTREQVAKAVANFGKVDA